MRGDSPITAKFRQTVFCCDFISRSVFRYFCNNFVFVFGDFFVLYAILHLCYNFVLLLHSILYLCHYFVFLLCAILYLCHNFAFLLHAILYLCQIFVFLLRAIFYSCHTFVFLLCEICICVTISYFCCVPADSITGCK